MVAGGGCHRVSNSRRPPRAGPVRRYAFPGQFAAHSRDSSGLGAYGRVFLPPTLAGSQPLIAQDIEEQYIVVDAILQLVPLEAAGRVVALLGQRGRRARVQLPDV